MMGSLMGRGNQYIQLVKVLYFKLPTNGKQLPAFPLEVRAGFKLRSQRLEAIVSPLCHSGPQKVVLLLTTEKEVIVTAFIIFIVILYFLTSLGPIQTWIKYGH